MFTIQNETNNFKGLMYLKMPKHLLTLALALLLCCSLQAQTRKLDSLDQLISKAKTDTDRIWLNIKKISILGRSNLDTAILLDKQLLKEAEKANFYNGIVALHNQLANNYIFKGNYEEAKKNIEFLEKFVKPSDSLDITGNYSAYGMMYGIQGKYDSSIKYYLKAIDINERLNNVYDLPGNYANVAIGYQQLANFPKALEYQLRSLKLAEARKDEDLQAKTLLNMGITYEQMDDTLKAEQNYLAARAIAVKNEFKIVELYVYSNLSSLYINRKRWSDGYKYAMMAAELSSTTGDIGIKAASLSKAATALANQHKFKEAAELSRQSIRLADSSSQPINISQALGAMAETFYLQKKYAEAIPYFEKSFKASNGASDYEPGSVVSYKNLSDSYEKTGNYIKALANYKRAANIKDSLTRKSNIRKATEVSMNYEFDKKQEVLAAEKKRDDEIAKTKQEALIAGLILVFILALVAFKGFKTKQKANKLLQLQKQETEATLSELKTTQAQLIQSEKMASLGELTAGIAHEIQNPLNFVNNFSEVNKEMLEELKTERLKPKEDRDEQTEGEIINDVIDNSEKINHHGKRAANIVKGMLQHSRTSTGAREPTNIKALADEYLRLSYHGLRAKDKSFNAEMETNFDESIGKINIVQQDIGRVLLNLFNNAFYAVNEKAKLLANSYEPTVSVTTKKTDNHVIITVSDNGNGIPQNIVDKIFQPFFTTKPTGSGTGLGLSLSYDIVKAHGGEIKVESKEGEGTEFIIQLPVV